MNFLKASLFVLFILPSYSSAAEMDCNFRFVQNTNTRPVSTDFVLRAGEEKRGDNEAILRLGNGDLISRDVSYRIRLRKSGAGDLDAVVSIENPETGEVISSSRVFESSGKELILKLFSSIGLDAQLSCSPKAAASQEDR